MKVLILTYYWPPAGGSGVQRWLKFVKYLRDYGIEPVVYTVDNANYEAVDNSLVSEIPQGIEVLKKSILEPNTLLKKKKVATASVSTKPSLVQRLMQYVRGNFFIPDARVLWVKPSKKYLKNYLKDNLVDVIISTGPPHSMHLIGMQLQQEFGIKWVADFRDPMANLFYNKDLMLSKKVRSKLVHLEDEIVANATAVITVGEQLGAYFRKKNSNTYVITNGFDDEVVRNSRINLDQKFTLAHIGLLPHQSNPEILWSVLEELVNEDVGFASDLELKLIGNISNKVLESIELRNLTSKLKRTGYVSHEKAIQLQKSSQVLLLLIPNVEDAKGIITGKIFEYLRSGRPIIGLGPKEGDAAQIISETQTGNFFAYTEREELKSKVVALYADYKKGVLSVEASRIEKYHRKNLTASLAAIIKSL